MTEDNRLTQVVTQTREELIEIKSAVQRVEEMFERSNKRIEDDMKDLRTRIDAHAQVMNDLRDHEKRLVRIENTGWRLIMVVLVSFIGALVALVIKT